MGKISGVTQFGRNGESRLLGENAKGKIAGRAHEILGGSAQLGWATKNGGGWANQAKGVPAEWELTDGGGPTYRPERDNTKPRKKRNGGMDEDILNGGVDITNEESWDKPVEVHPTTMKETTDKQHRKGKKTRNKHNSETT